MVSDPDGDREQSLREQRILLLPPTRRDAEAIQEILGTASIKCAVCRTVEELCQEVDQGSAAMVVSEESLAQDEGRLSSCLMSQPVWSDLPIVVLSKSGSESPSLGPAMATLGNVSVLERPVRVSTFLSVVNTALRARVRQYQVRDQFAILQQAEEERETLLQSEQAARAELEHANQMKDEFLATLSHELRNPLNAILGWSQILRMGTPSQDEIDEAIEIIERNAQVQAQIIEDLLDMSRIISGKVRLDMRHTDLIAVIKASIETVKPTADAKGIELKTVFDRSGGLVFGDPNRLQQVFWNLLTNAVKFTPKGGVVQILLKDMKSHTEISVIDNGEGIDPKFLPYMFDRFRQADASTTRRHGGLGLGLAIVRQIVELHGGSIQARSSGPGSGSTFTLTLPIPERHLNSVADSQHLLSSNTRERPSNTDISDLKVLIVDDEPDARALLRRLLEDCQAKVFAAASAKNALQLIEIERPDVVISDIGMPGEDGYSLIRKIRALPGEQGGKTPAIALTAYARLEDRNKIIVSGFQHHLVKPVEPSELIGIIANIAQSKSR